MLLPDRVNRGKLKKYYARNLESQEYNKGPPDEQERELQEVPDPQEAKGSQKNPKGQEGEGNPESQKNPKGLEDAKPRYKARLVAKGFKQQKGIDFDEIFSPVVKMTILCTLLALAAIEDMELKQMDVKIAFLHWDLHEDLYMEQPTEFVVHASRKLVCCLCKTLYELKQSPREWYHNFHAFMRSEGYIRSHDEYPCLYTCKAMDCSLIVLVLYVDDMLIARKSVVDVDALKHRPHETFAMKDLGDASHILGMQITRYHFCRLLFLSQKEYIDKVLECFHMEGGKALIAPLPSICKT
ncbi:hypothetical protein L7F22_027014 [Adiantum nelumboides]|nr:hypothetical protein [Adiantum nelumboides]